MLTENNKSSIKNIDSDDLKWLTSIDCKRLDYIAIKFKENTYSTVLYYLEGSEIYDEKISDNEKELVRECKSLGCYGNSELVVNAFDNSVIGNFYLGLKIVTIEQYNKILHLMFSRIDISQKQESVLGFLNSTLQNYKLPRSYHPLYYCGIVNDDKCCKSIKFYFIIDNKVSKTLGYNILLDLEKQDIISKDSSFGIVKQLLIEKAADLAIIGVEFSNDGGIRFKFFVEPKCNLIPFLVSNGYDFDFNFITELVNSSTIDRIHLIQLSSATDCFEMTLGFYLEPKKKSDNYYELREGIVPRDICSVYFLIDIHNANYYDEGSLCRINRTGYEIVKILQKNKVCNITGILSYFLPLIRDYDLVNKADIEQDIIEFLSMLKEKNYILEYKQ